MNTFPSHSLRLMFLLTLGLQGSSAFGQTFDFSPSTPVTIPDASESGTYSKGVVSPAITGIVRSITVDLNLQGSVPEGGSTGDLYLALYHAGKASVLLNRLGRDNANPFGYDDNGDIHITLDDSASNDVHVYQNATGQLPSIGLTGRWQPDGRTTNFKSVISSDSRSALLNQFTGTPIHGDWLLFMADVSGGGVTQLSGWSLNIVPLAAVPEPMACASAVSVLLGFWAVARRMHSGTRRDAESSSESHSSSFPSNLRISPSTE